jgi:hypothetical protein
MRGCLGGGELLRKANGSLKLEYKKSSWQFDDGKSIIVNKTRKFAVKL